MRAESARGHYLGGTVTIILATAWIYCTLQTLILSWRTRVSRRNALHHEPFKVPLISGTLIVVSIYNIFSSIRGGTGGFQHTLDLMSYQHLLPFTAWLMYTIICEQFGAKSVLIVQ